MSYAELFTVNANGDVVGGAATVPNNHRGAPLLWEWVRAKYMPKLDRTDLLFGSNLDPFWALVRDARLPVDERVAFATTFDNMIIRREHVPHAAACLRSTAAKIGDMHGGPIHAFYWPDLMLKAIEDDSVLGLAFNQCSANADTWETYDRAKAEADEDYAGDPYNIGRDEGHSLLFKNYPELLMEGGVDGGSV